MRHLPVQNSKPPFHSSNVIECGEAHGSESLAVVCGHGKTTRVNLRSLNCDSNFTIGESSLVAQCSTTPATVAATPPV